MKQLLFIMLSLLSVPVSALAQSASYAGGDGSKENPYLISNADELAKLAQDVNHGTNFSRGLYFRLTRDIVINEQVNQQELGALQSGSAFPLTPMIGSYASDTDYKAFQGVFDGDGHTISGVYLQGSVNYMALFRVLEDAEIRNLGICDEFIQANAYFGGIAGRAINSRIINCYVSGSNVRGYGSNGGGIAAQAMGSTKVQNCYVEGTLDGKNDMGGIVGRVGNGDYNAVLIENCYTTATIGINAARTNKAGVTATNSAGSTVRYCYFTADAGNSAVWPAQDSGTTLDCELTTAERMEGDEFLDLLNERSKLIPAACRWQKGMPLPIHNYLEATPDDGQRDISAMATDPVPANGDVHADMDENYPMLSWTAARDGKTVRQYLFLGTDSAAIANATPDKAEAILGVETSYNPGSLSNIHTYYWRIDREDAEGTITRGDVWTFQPRHLAFPGAEGYGRFARGGRGGHVVYVSSLKDDGSEGTLRWALTNGSGPRTVLFRVAGVIDMNYKTCWVDDQVTIAAQTAPGKGICIKHSDIGIGSDNIVRFLRARRGLGTSEETGNAIGTVYSDHTILDHVTASWGTDETFSSRGSKNITLQRSLISEALGIAGHRNYAAGTNHGYAATIGGDIGSFHHNLLADCEGRNWSMGGGTDANGEYAGRLDIFNNVVYNWHRRTTDGGAHEVNFVGNYYKMGIDTQEKCLFTLDIEGNLKGTQSAYISGNVRDNYNGTITTDQLGDTYRMRIHDGRSSLDWEWLHAEPFFPSYATLETAHEAYKNVLSDVGAHQPMQDLTDCRMVTETLNRSYTFVGSKSGIRGEIDDEQDAGGFEEYPEELRPVGYDTDYDGLPNWWEEIRGTDPRTRTRDFKESNSDLDGDGYTELEHYLDFMAQPHVFLQPNGTAAIDLRPLFAGYTDSPAFQVEQLTASLPVRLTVAGHTLTLQAGDAKTIGEVSLRVADADGHSYARRLCIVVTDHSTVITGMQGKTLGTESHPAPLYDLTGRRVTKPQHGIYISKDRKVIIKGPSL